MFHIGIVVVELRQKVLVTKRKETVELNKILLSECRLVCLLTSETEGERPYIDTKLSVCGGSTCVSLQLFG